MKNDIRIDLSFLTHRKRKRLIGLLGPQGVVSLIDLWLSTAQNRSRGILTGMNEGDIALDAQWPGDPVEFCRTLCEIGFLDRDETGTYAIHDWKDNQPFMYYAEERSKRAREAAETRWKKKNSEGKRKLRKQNAHSMLPACDQHTKGNAPSPTPTPTPIPTPNPNNTPPTPQGESVYVWFEDKFWPMWPRKVAKAAALRAIKKLTPAPELRDDILEAVDNQSQWPQWTKDRGQFIPHAATWITGRRWEDKIPEPQKSAPEKKPIWGKCPKCKKETLLEDLKKFESCPACFKPLSPDRVRDLISNIGKELPKNTEGKEMKGKADNHRQSPEDLKKVQMACKNILDLDGKDDESSWRKRNPTGEDVKTMLAWLDKVKGLLSPENSEFSGSKKKGMIELLPIPFSEWLESEVWRDDPKQYLINLLPPPIPGGENLDYRGGENAANA
jgi:hypothetical protein